MRNITVAIACLVLAGCGDQATWVKDGASGQDVARDSYSCERDMRQSGYFGSGLLGEIAAEGFYNRCMEANGYRFVRATPAARAISTPRLANEPPVDLDGRLKASAACQDQVTLARYPSYPACFFDHFK